MSMYIWFPICILSDFNFSFDAATQIWLFPAEKLFAYFATSKPNRNKTENQKDKIHAHTEGQIDSKFATSFCIHLKKITIMRSISVQIMIRPRIILFYAEFYNQPGTSETPCILLFSIHLFTLYIIHFCVNMSSVMRQKLLRDCRLFPKFFNISLEIKNYLDSM